jgi:ribosomal protein L11 methylase PrmA
MKSSASFRDPSGFIFTKDETVLRQINNVYQQQYDHFMSSGLYECLVKEELLLPFQEVEKSLALNPESAYKVIQPKQIPFISYPYEWSFSQLKEAATLTLMIQIKALAFGMSLKDSSAYNIQFIGSKAVFMDHLSFEMYDEGEPWVAYRQFCQHFLAPLALASLRDIRLTQLLQVYIDGIPLDLAKSLLPFSSKFNFPLLINLHLHAKKQQSFADQTIGSNKRKITETGLKGILDNLLSGINKLEFKLPKTEWGDYYNMTNYSDNAFEIKKEAIESYIKKVSPSNVWDLGGNIGIFSRLASSQGIQTVSFDIDPVAVERNYLKAKDDKDSSLLPLLLDLTNPSPAIGWANKERESLVTRGPADLAMALALIHHLAISNNLPFENIASYFSMLCKWLIIEFVPKEDSQVQRLLSTREDVFPNYNSTHFLQAFATSFELINNLEITGSHRTLYLMRSKFYS